jgi:membrane protein implicated in regulation of membrane protease activity
MPRSYSGRRVSARRAATETTLRVFARYALFQSPGWLAAAVAAGAAVDWLGVAPWIAATGAALWLVKDLVLFPFVRRAYERGATTHGEVGERGIAEGAIDPEGWVRIGAERWRARLARGAATIEAGAEVRVVAVEGLVVRVEPAE